MKLIFNTVFLFLLAGAAYPQGDGPAVFDAPLSFESTHLWDAKWIDYDGDGTPDDNRVLSNYPFIVSVYGSSSIPETGGIATGIIANRNKVVSVAHRFVKDGTWQITGSARRPTEEEFRAYTVWVQLCGRDYPLKNIEAGTLDYMAEAHKDYAVLETIEPLCDATQSATFGTLSALLTTRRAYAVEIYHKASIQNPFPENGRMLSASEVAEQDVYNDLQYRAI